MKCDNCSRAAAGSWHGFNSSCDGCRARAVARSPLFADVKKAGKQTAEYRRTLAQLGVTHEAVKAADSAEAKC